MQVSRLGMPLVNEVVIGLKDKDKFNTSKPKDDGQFADYVTNPTLPALVEILFSSAGVRAPTKFPRADLVTAFLTGVPGLNQPATVTASEMLRLNTSIPALPKGSQNPLGVLAGDNAGFPNGRRPGDDIVDITVRVAMGVLCTLNNPTAFGCVAGRCSLGRAGLHRQRHGDHRCDVRCRVPVSGNAASGRAIRSRDEEVLSDSKHWPRHARSRCSLTGCGSSSDDSGPPPPAPPPIDTMAQEDAAASASIAGLIAFIQSMIASLTLETNEPRNIGGITPPVTETAEPTAI